MSSKRFTGLTKHFVSLREHFQLTDFKPEQWNNYVTLEVKKKNKGLMSQVA